MGTALKHPMPDRVKPSFVIFYIQELWICQKLQWRLNPVWHRMVYSCIHMTTVDVKGLTTIDQRVTTLVTCDWSYLSLHWMMSQTSAASLASAVTKQTHAHTNCKYSNNPSLQCGNILTKTDEEMSVCIRHLTQACDNLIAVVSLILCTMF